MTQQIIVGCPGQWKDRDDIIRSIALANKSTDAPEYLAAGRIISNMKSGQTFEFEIYDHDPHMREAFEIAGQGRLSAEELAAIDGHTFTAYLVHHEPSPDVARQMLRAAAFLLEAGGLAVKVETSGVAHSADRWRYYASTGSTLSVYDAFVVLVGGDEFNYTCGMHAFGLADVSVTKDVPIDEAPEILNAFNQWQLLEQPELTDGAVFSTGKDEPNFCVSRCQYGYDEEDLTNNPFGRWHLELGGADRAGQSPSQAAGAPLFMALAKDDPEVRDCVDRARQTVDAYIEHFRSPFEYGHYMFKMFLEDGAESAHLWLYMVDVSGDTLIGELFEVPPEFPSYHSGQRLEISKHDITDWCIMRNGTVTGGFSRRLQRRREPPHDRREFDLYSGMISYAPLDEIPGGGT
jgi:uncharacterized protein YegJ (DUF2314 family)